MYRFKTLIMSILFIATFALTPNLSADRGGGGGHGGGGHGGGGFHGGGHHGDWHGDHHGWRGNDYDDFYGFGYWGWPSGYDYYNDNATNCYYYQGSDGNWYYTCSGY